jgi:Tol biopolymer transport system component
MRRGPSFALLAATLVLAPGAAHARFMPSVYRLVATSFDGRLIAFESPAGDLVPGDSNGVSDVFLRDRLTGTTELVSVGAGGAPADGPSISPAICADGRYVAFVSSATNLIPGFRASGSGLYLRDRALRLTTRLAPGAGGVPPSVARGVSISGDGRLVAFASDAPNLVPGDDDGTADYFVADLRKGTTQLVSGDTRMTSATVRGLQVPALSADGKYVAFPGFLPTGTNQQLQIFTAGPLHD